MAALTEAGARSTDERRVGRARVRRLATARVISYGGTQAAGIALVYQIYATTHSGAWVAAALFATITAGGLLGPESGWAADRFERRRVMVASELAAGAAYLAMVPMHRPGLLIVGALVAAVVGSPFRAASAAAIPNLVATNDLAWANALLGTASNLALVAGPIVGGALVAASGARLVFAINAATFLVSGAAIAMTRGHFGGNASKLQGHGPHGALLAGFRLLVHHPVLAPLGAASALAFGSFGAAVTVDPVLAHAFHAGSLGYGLLTSVWGGGAVLGAIVAGKTVRPGTAARAVAWGMAAMVVSLGSIVVLPNFPLIVAAGALGGVGNGFVFIPWLLVVPHHTADAIRGRVIAATDAFNQAAFLCGMGVGVPFIALVGAHHAYGLTGVLLAVSALLASRAVPRSARAEPTPAS
jgi:MFS family permease